MDELGVGIRIDDYQIQRALGARGGVAVYEAKHVMLPRRVAICVSTPSKLLREACIVEALDHAGIPRLYECGVLPDGRAWMATELVIGPTVARRQSNALAVAMLLQHTATVLAHAHARGVVHCELVPSAITLLEGKRFPLAVTRWNSARTFDMPAPAPAPAADVRPYAAPELVRGDMLDGRADIYSLGVIAYEVLYGVLPTHHVPLRGDVPDKLLELLCDMISAHPEERPTAERVVIEATRVIEEMYEPTQPRSRAITSEIVAEVSGEIHMPAA